MSSSSEWDVIVVGAGPAGSACAAETASAGLRTLIIERANFPRDKVCGDCVNPGCWPVLERIGAAEKIRDLPHCDLTEVDLIGLRGRIVRFPLQAGARGEIAIRRSILDAALLENAVARGAHVEHGSPVIAIEGSWRVQTNRNSYTAGILVAADGRNSTVARLLGLAPRAARNRIAIQTHLTAPLFGPRVTLRFRPEGYCGMAGIGNGLLNICLVSTSSRLPSLKRWAEAELRVPPSQSWQTIAPLARPPITSTRRGLFFIGDSARVVEPFTGEGIYYALASGELAAQHILADSAPERFRREHAALYRNRLWVNRIARAAVTFPQFGSLLLDLLNLQPALLRFLSRRILGSALREVP
jgi:flavin-dependent dehydrogenase